MYISKSRLDVMFAKKNPLDNGYLSTDGGKSDQTYSWLFTVQFPFAWYLRFILSICKKTFFES